MERMMRPERPAGGYPDKRELLVLLVGAADELIWRFTARGHWFIFKTFGADGSVCFVFHAQAAVVQTYGLREDES